jgi:hypothetical protein
MRFIILIFLNYQLEYHFRSGHQKPFKIGHIVPVVICDLSRSDLVLWAAKCEVDGNRYRIFNSETARARLPRSVLFPSRTSSPMPFDQRYRQQGLVKFCLRFYVFSFTLKFPVLFCYDIPNKLKISSPHTGVRIFHRRDIPRVSFFRPDARAYFSDNFSGGSVTYDYIGKAKRKGKIVTLEKR